jgi:hypothetical protein
MCTAREGIPPGSDWDSVPSEFVVAEARIVGDFPEVPARRKGDVFEHPPYFHFEFPEAPKFSTKLV